MQSLWSFGCPTCCWKFPYIDVHGLNIFVAQMVVTTRLMEQNGFCVGQVEHSNITSRLFPLNIAVYFLYDLSPITVIIREERRNFLHFITRLCAVLGGTFALTGMLDRWIYRLLEAVTKKNSRSLVR